MLLYLSLALSLMSGRCPFDWLVVLLLLVVVCDGGGWRELELDLVVAMAALLTAVVLVIDATTGPVPGEISAKL